MQKYFVVLSGPSGVGKGSLQRAVARISPELVRARPILYTSRVARGGEVDGEDYHFRTADFIQGLESDPGYAVAKVRSDWQAIDLREVERLLETHDAVFAEAFCTFGDTLKAHADGKGFKFSSVFLLPLPPSATPADIAAEMCRKLAIRGTDAWDKITERAISAAWEIEQSHAYTHRILNRAGEDDVAQWGDCGVCYGKRGNRCVRSLSELGQEARWLVETFKGIFVGQIPATEPGQCLSFL